MGPNLLTKVTILELFNDSALRFLSLVRISLRRQFPQVCNLNLLHTDRTVVEMSLDAFARIFACQELRG